VADAAASDAAPKSGALEALQEPKLGTLLFLLTTAAAALPAAGVPLHLQLTQLTPAMTQQPYQQLVEETCSALTAAAAVVPAAGAADAANVMPQR
jgi:hypothetical protein